MKRLLLWIAGIFLGSIYSSDSLAADPVGAAFADQAIECAVIRDDPRNPTFYAELEVSSQCRVETVRVLVLWRSPVSEELVAYKMPSAWGYAAERVRRRLGDRRPEILRTEIIRTDRGGSLLGSVRIENYGGRSFVRNPTGDKAFVRWESIDQVGGGTITVPRGQARIVWQGDARILYAEREPD